MARRPLGYVLIVCAVAAFSAALAAQAGNLATSTKANAEVSQQRLLDPQTGGTELIGEVRAPLVVNYTLVNGLDANAATVVGAVNCSVSLEPSLAGDSLNVTIVPKAAGDFSFTLNVPNEQGDTQEVPVEGVMLLHSETCHEDEFGVWHCHHDDHHHCAAGEAVGPWLLLSGLVSALVLAIRRRNLA